MLSVTFKKERLRKKSIPLMKRLFLSKASRIFYASLPDQEWGMAHQFPAPYFDFRAEQIKRRIQLKEEKFFRHLPEYRQLKLFSEQFSPSKRLLFGNAWPSDLFLLENLPSDVFVLVIPHKLEPAIINEFSEAFKKWGRTAIELTGESEFPKSNTYILNRKGVLCELYADFDFAYVGGGYEAGVHSLLEPLVAGSASIACGKLHQRSTEFDMAFSLNKVTEVKDATDFKNWLLRTESVVSSTNLNDLFEKYEKYKRDIILC
jgi:3-deoxy-D-manno-octulosonic-acid transferase